MSNTSEIEIKPQTENEAIGDKSVLSIDQQIIKMKQIVGNFKFLVEIGDNGRWDMDDVNLAQSVLNSLEALKIKIDANYDFHVVILPSHKMKYFISYLEEMEAKERKEQNNG